jgi:LPS sulfotransferase NodH
VEAIAARHSDGGVFGAKVHRYQFLQLERDRLADSPLDLLPRDRSHDARLVLLTRDDRRRQAISILLARTSGVYAVSAEGEEAQLPEHVGRWSRDSRFDSPSGLAAALDEILATIVEHEQGWRRWCEASGLEVLSLSYETLCDDYPGTIDRVMRHVTGTGFDRDAVPKPLSRLQRGTETERLLRLWKEQGEQHGGV